MKIKKGDLVAVEYTGTFDNGEVFDTNKHGDHCHPLEFEVGAGMVIPGFDKAIEGMEKGEEKKININFKDAYGEKRSELVRTIPKPPGFPPQAKEGMMIGVGPSPDKQIPALIIKLTDTEVTLDLNHPLAGKNLNFEIKILSVNEPSSNSEEEENEDEELSSETEEINEEDSEEELN
jgi:FKBP-type peptidyl-prolyl cis-trans isomerase 2